MDMLSKVVLNSEDKSQKMHFTDNKSGDILSEEVSSHVIIREYYNLDLTFSSTFKDARLYLDGLEIIDNKNIQVDSSGKEFLKPSETAYQLFNYDNSTIEKMLVPGFYQMTLVENNQEYYAFFEVVPKSLSKPQWIAMKNEIEETLTGLSQSFNRKNLSSSQKNDLNQIYYKFDYIKKMYKRYLKITRDLISSPEYRLEKRYEWKELNQNPTVDEKSIRKKLEKPDKQEAIYSPSRILNYQTKENKWLKASIKKINKFNVDYLSFLSKKLEEIEHDKDKNKRYKAKVYTLEEEENEIRQIMNILKQILTVNHFLLNQEWMDEIKGENTIYPTSSMMMNQKYNFYYKWLQQMKKEEMHVILPNSIKYAWKRTDELFEIWTYIKMISIIENLGYEPKSGWIYSNESLKIPDLSEGTFITFINDEVKINLHYNSRLKRKNSQTTVDHPLYTKAENDKPDIRLDVFHNDSYLGSLIIDAKYRSFEIMTKRDTRYKDNVMKQLHNYKNSPESKNYYYPSLQRFIREQLSPIRQVWVLYPHSDDTNKPKKYEIEEEENIHFYEISPYYPTDEISRSLLSYIDGLMKSKDYFNLHSY